MSLKIKVEIVNIGPDAYVALFRGIVEGSDIDIEKLPMVSLSRIHGQCHFRLDKLHIHDHHAPPFGDQVLMNTYIQRVINEIKSQCIDYGIALADEIQQVNVPKLLHGNPLTN